MPVHSRSHGLADHQPDPRAGRAFLVAPLCVHDEVPLDGSRPVLHAWNRTPSTGSSGIAPEAPSCSAPTQAVSARRPLRRRLDTIARPGARPHPQPKPVYSRSFAVVRLESPLALGHGSYLLVRLAPRRLVHRLITHAEVDAVAVSKLFVSLANRRGPRKTDSRGSLPYRRLSGDCSRVLTSIRWSNSDEPVARRTDNPAPSALRIHCCHNRHRCRPTRREVCVNVAERLVPSPETC